MALQNRTELAETLAGGERLGAVFARHAYGMERWVELLHRRAPSFGDPATRELVIALAADNARHAALFRARALAHGIDPSAYACPAEGEVIYTRMAELETLDELLGYSLGSLDHFLELLAVYAGAAEGEDLVTIERIRADVVRARGELRGRVGPAGASRADEAHDLYRVRELVETPLYACAG